ncbi:MAG TPA: pyridoxal-5'-phosphate-dependent protein subunit beta [Rhodospirillaceae bacterium]|nr:pyridoxal-5'-phosphate-dependent protein subunit beta [Rhodospirillaceae bacterium]
MIVNKMTDLIGNTPLLKLDAEVTGLKNIDLYAKMEMLNPFGSVKDRTAWAMIKDDLAEIKAKNMTIYENSSGNTGKSLQAIAGMHGIKFRLVSALSKVEEQKQVMQILGAEIEEIAGASDCFDPSDNYDPQYLIERTARSRPGEIYFTSQFTNLKNPAYHEATTGEEIARDLGRVDYFVNALGTTGSSLGISRRLKRDHSDLKTIGIVPSGHHFVPGIRNLNQMWESGIFERSEYDSFFPVTEQDAIDGMLTLNRRCGVLCGISAGANYSGAIQYLSDIDKTLTERKTAVFIVCDRMEWYVSYLKERRPDIFSEPVKENALTHYVADLSSGDMYGIEANEMDHFITQNSNSIMIDIRSAQSFSLVNIPHSMNMPLELFQKWIDGQNPFPADMKVILICAVGEKSGFYAGYLRSLGCHAYHLSGGMGAWREGQCLLAA